MSNSSIQYTAFGNPMHTYYGANSQAAVPSWLTGLYQVRQFGLGDATTLGSGGSVLSGLANPPAAMVTAADHVRTQMVMTAPTKERYSSIGEEPVTAPNGTEAKEPTVVDKEIPVASTKIENTTAKEEK